MRPSRVESTHAMPWPETSSQKCTPRVNYTGGRGGAVGEGEGLARRLNALAAITESEIRSKLSQRSERELCRSHRVELMHQC